MTGLSALYWLTISLIVRLLRYGMIVRSLTFPGALIAITLLLTVGVVSGTQPPPILAVTPNIESVYVDTAAKEVGLEMVVSTNPKKRVQKGRAAAGSDGVTYWVTGTNRTTLAGEHALRKALGSSWRPAIPHLPAPEQIQQLGTLIVRFLLGIFSLYGVVFGAAMIARDREDGSLEVERALPVPSWVHGTARLSAGALLLGAFATISIWLVQALVGVADSPEWLGHGYAACLTSLAFGLTSAGRARLNTGFGSALALGLTLTTAFLALGYVLPSVGKYLPLGSIATGGSPIIPLANAVLLALLSLLWFTRFGLKS